MAIIERAPCLTGDTEENPSAIKPSCSLGSPAKPTRWLTGVNRSLLLFKYLLPGPGRGEEKTVLSLPSQAVQARENTKTLSVSRWWKVENRGLGSHSRRGDQFLWRPHRCPGTHVPALTHHTCMPIINKSNNKKKGTTSYDLKSFITSRAATVFCHRDEEHDLGSFWLASSCHKVLNGGGKVDGKSLRWVLLSWQTDRSWLVANSIVSETWKVQFKPPSRPSEM